jgi:hypothetical protein
MIRITRHGNNARLAQEAAGSRVGPPPPPPSRASYAAILTVFGMSGGSAQTLLGPEEEGYPYA